MSPLAHTEPEVGTSGLRAALELPDSPCPSLHGCLTPASPSGSTRPSEGCRAVVEAVCAGEKSKPAAAHLTLPRRARLLQHQQTSPDTQQRENHSQIYFQKGLWASSPLQAGSLQNTAHAPVIRLEGDARPNKTPAPLFVSIYCNCS